MLCDQVKPVLVGYERKELPMQTATEVAAHVGQCRACAAELQSLQTLNRLLDVELQPAAQARERFLFRLRQEGMHKPPRSRIVALFRVLWPAQPLAAFSYSAVLVLAGLVGGQLLPPHSLGVGADPAQLAEQYMGKHYGAQLCLVPAPPAGNLL